MDESASDAPDYLIIDTSDLIKRTLTPSQQQVLRLAGEENGAAGVAQALRIPLARARERVSRARARARDRWRTS